MIKQGVNDSPTAVPFLPDFSLETLLCIEEARVEPFHVPRRKPRNEYCLFTIMPNKLMRVTAVEKLSKNT